MDLADYAARHGLKRVGARPPIIQYIKQVWSRRVFAFTLASARIEARNQANRLGLAWLIITPILDALIYGIVFGVLQGDKRPDNFIQFLIIGIFFHRFLSDCVSNGARAITNNQALVQSLSFPRMVLPLATAIEHFINFLPMLGLILILNLALGVMPAWHWFYLLPVVAMAALFNTGAVMFMARLAVHFRDISQLVPFFNRFMRYFSGVFYSPAAFVGSMPALMLLFDFNPLYDFMEMARVALIPDYAIDPKLVLIGVAWAVASFVGGSLFFWVAEERYGQAD